MRELLSKDINLTDRVNIRITLSEGDRGKLIDIRRWEKFFNWETRDYNDEFKPTKKGVAFAADRDVAERIIDALSSIKDALPEEDESNTEQD